MTTTNQNSFRSNRLSYKLGGYSFTGFIIGLFLFIIGILSTRVYGSDHFIPLGLVGVGILVFFIGVIFEILVFLVAITE